MKTLSLKMLLVAALVVSPAVMANDVKPESESYLNQAKNLVVTVSGAVGGAAAALPSAVVAFPSEVYAWAKENKKNTVAAAIIATLVAKDVYNYVTAPAKTKTVKATEAN